MIRGEHRYDKLYRNNWRRDPVSGDNSNKQIFILHIFRGNKQIDYRRVRQLSNLLVCRQGRKSAYYPPATIISLPVVSHKAVAEVSGNFKNRKPIGEVGCCESGMAERIHWWTERCLRSPLFRSLSLTIYLPTYLSSMNLSIYLSLSLSLSPFHLITYLSV